MEKETLKNKTPALTDNVKNIVLCDSTKILLICRAKLSEIFNEVNAVCGSDEYDLPQVDAFKVALSNLDEELMKLISIEIRDNSLNSNYREM